MKNRTTLFLLFISFNLLISCNAQQNDVNENPTSFDKPKNPEPPKEASYKSKKNINYLALGDSYTKAESVDAAKSFPAQLKDNIESQTDKKVALKIVAQTGWRTDNLIKAITLENLNNEYDLVSLLIGVNNQFQNINFDLYKTEFNQLLDTAIKLAQNNRKNVFVVSIPDYAFTPFGQGSKSISQGIDRYNDYARAETIRRKISFIEITEITRRGLDEKNLVASDDLHPSADAYSEFITKIYPVLFP